MNIDPGRQVVRDSGYSYLPRFFSTEEAEAIAEFCASLPALWERRHGKTGRRLTRPVYWLGAWQFACLGYYSEPAHVQFKCLRAEPLPSVLRALLERLRPELLAHGEGNLPNTCLINYYGQTPKSPGRPPVDLARLKMHRDSERGPVVMFSVGQPAQLEFLTGEGPDPCFGQWIRNRSAVIISGRYKDELYHRVARVRYGELPVLHSAVDDFELRRISVSFRYVPEDRIYNFSELPSGSQAMVRGYVEELAEVREHYQRQLQ